MTPAWVTVHDTGGWWATRAAWHAIFTHFFFIIWHGSNMAAAVPTTKQSMFPMTQERMTQLNNRMTAQYSGVVVIDDVEHKRVAPTTVRSARWVQSQMGAAGFPIRVDHESWRAFM